VSFRARIAPLILAGAIAGARADAQSVVVRDPGPAQVGRRLARALTAPHRLIAPGPIPTILARDSAYATTVIVLAHNVVIEGRVRGDVFVVGGDAFLHPGAVVDGRVTAQPTHLRQAREPDGDAVAGVVVGQLRTELLDEVPAAAHDQRVRLVARPQTGITRLPYELPFSSPLP